MDQIMTRPASQPTSDQTYSIYSLDNPRPIGGQPNTTYLQLLYQSYLCPSGSAFTVCLCNSKFSGSMKILFGIWVFQEKYIYRYYLHYSDGKWKGFLVVTTAITLVKLIAMVIVNCVRVYHQRLMNMGRVCFDQCGI